MAKLTLAAVAASCVQTPIVLAGQEFLAVPLDAVETAELLAIMPQPVPPLEDDPDAGSAAPKVPNPRNPEYRSEHARWYLAFRAAALAIAISKADPQQLDESIGRWQDPRSLGATGRIQNQQFVISGGDLIGRVLNREVVAAFDRLADGGGPARERAEGN